MRSCPNSCGAGCRLGRREFLKTSACLAGAAILGGCGTTGRTGPAGPTSSAGVAPIQLKGPAARCVPVIKAAFVRRKGAYGLRWPGAVYDGEAALKMYAERIREAAGALRLKADLRPDPIYAAAEADAWIAEAKSSNPDGLLLVLLDRQEHAWPTAVKAIDSGIRTVVFSPVGTSFTTNTAAPSKKAGAVIYSTDDQDELVYGMKMLGAAARMRAMRFVVIRGAQGGESQYPQLGINLRTVPSKTFADIYNAMPESDEMRAIADEHLRGAQRTIGATRQDVVNGARSYVVARTILQQEEADGITMDCLGALGPTKLALPCLAWSRMLDEGVPAACEADTGAAASHTVVQYLFDRPGFQVDPVAETARQAIIGSHCTCATRLNGFGRPPEPYLVRHHHGERDATIQTVWREGQPVTSIDMQSAAKGGNLQMIVQSGRVLGNVSVPPAGGCVVAVMVKFDGATDVLANPGFHQIFFYGDYRRRLLDFCRLMNIEPVTA
jgi:hypothetical protein